MDVKQVLRELAAIPDQKEPVASVFLDTWRVNEHQRSAVRVFVQDQLRAALKAVPETEAHARLKRTLDPIDSYVTGLLRQRHDDNALGVALFSCAPIGLFRAIATRVPFEPMEFHLESRPHILPIARTLGAVPPALVALIDSEGGTIFEVGVGVSDSETHIGRPFPGMHHQGGWSQRRFQRRLGELRERNLRAVAEPFIKMAEAHPSAMLALAGQHFLLAAFEDLLPERIRARIVSRLSRPTVSTENELRPELLSALAPELEAAVRQRLAHERDLAVAEASRGGLGVVGVRETLLALGEGRVHRIILEQGFGGEGFRCERCGALTASGTACDYCGGQATRVFLPEELVRRALQEDAELAFLPQGIGFPDGSGLGAQLRHRGSMGTGITAPAPSP